MVHRSLPSHPWEFDKNMGVNKLFIIEESYRALRAVSFWLFQTLDGIRKGSIGVESS